MRRRRFWLLTDYTNGANKPKQSDEPDGADKPNKPDTPDNADNRFSQRVLVR